MPSSAALEEAVAGPSSSGAGQTKRVSPATERVTRVLAGGGGQAGWSGSPPSPTPSSKGLTGLRAPWPGAQHRGVGGSGGRPLGLQEYWPTPEKFRSESEIQLCVTFLGVNVSCGDLSGMALV